MNPKKIIGTSLAQKKRSCVSEVFFGFLSIGLLVIIRLPPEVKFGKKQSQYFFVITQKSIKGQEKDYEFGH